MKRKTRRYKMRLQKGNQDCFDGNLFEERRIIASSPIMQAILRKIRGLSPNCSPILILGENGTGKKFMAHTIYNHHPNSQSLLSLACYDLSSELALFHLFGDKSYSGLLKRALGQTLFIEGIDALSLEVQSRLLAFFESPEGDHFLRVTRIITSAHSDLPDKLAKRGFSEKLFSILNKNLILLPTLKERTEDVPEFLNYFLERNRFTGHLTQQAIEYLKKHSWSGNIIELKNLCVRWSVLYKDQRITERDLPKNIQSPSELSYFIKYNPKIKLEAVINFYISQAVQHFKSKKEAGRALGISPKTIYNKLERVET